MNQADERAEGRVGVGVGRAGDRDHRRQLGVTEGREPGDDAGEHEGDDHGRAGVLGGRLAGRDEDAGADDAGDPERRQAEGPIAAESSRLRSVLACARMASRRSSRSISRHSSVRDADPANGNSRIWTTLTADQEQSGDRGRSRAPRLRRRRSARTGSPSSRRCASAAIEPYPSASTATRPRRAIREEFDDLAAGTDTGERGPHRRAGHRRAPPRRPRLRRPAATRPAQIQLIVDPRRRRRRRRSTTSPTSTSATGSASRAR